MMICPGTTIDCDNPGCRRGGCQGRKPELPLFKTVRATEPLRVTDVPLLTLQVPAKEAERFAA